MDECKPLVTGKKEGGSGDDDVARLVDAGKNQYVISNPKSGAYEMQQDLRLIGDLVVVFVAGTYTRSLLSST